VAEIAGGRFLYILCAVATAIAWGIFNALAGQTAISRIIFAMSRDGNMPKTLAKVHPRFKTPYVAAILVGVISLVLVAIFNQLGVAAISRLVNFGALTSFMVLNITIIYHFFIRKKTGEVGMHLILPLVGFLIIAYVWISLDGLSKIMGISWIIIGIVYYLILTKVMKKSGGMEIDV
jgi:amino acid transporter